jgi:SAM-dependent methyltransferase
VTAAADRWAEALGRWAIPDEILAHAPEPPWVLPTDIFVARAVRSRQRPTPARQAALDALGAGGTVLDVGAGAGAASLALIPPATAITAVDASAQMLGALQTQVDALAAEDGAPAVALRTVEGTWPEIADQVAVHDVVVCHHVVYNVAPIDRFLAALDATAARRVVLVASERHPLSWMAPLWRRFWDLDRPEEPTVDDLLAVLAELGIRPHVERFDEDDDTGRAAPGVDGHGGGDAHVASTRRRLCLPADRDPEVADALRAHPTRRPTSVAVWWDPR